MGKYSKIDVAYDKNKELDFKPVKPKGDCYGKTSSYFDQERWRREKNSWAERQVVREKQSTNGGRVKESCIGSLWKPKKK